MLAAPERIADSRTLRIADDDVGLHGSAHLRRADFPSEAMAKHPCRPVIAARIQGASTTCIRLHAWNSSA
ncbi:hypothetical protein [Bradyrhizobium sp. 5.13L]